MSIAKKITLAFVVILAMVATIGVVLLLESSRQSDTTTTMESRTLRSAIVAEEMKLSVTQVQQWLTDISATRGQNGLDDGLEKADQYAKLFAEQLEEMKKLNPEDQERLLELKTSFDIYYEFGTKMAKAFVTGGHEAGNQLMGEFDQRAEKLNKAVDAFREEKVQQITKAVSEIQDSIEMSNQMMIIFFVIVLVISGGIAYWLSRSIILPLRKLNQTALVIAKGKLDQPVNIRSRDEVGQLGEAFEKMRCNLQELIHEVRKTADEVVASASELSAGAEQTAASAKEISTSIDEIKEGAMKQQRGSNESAASMSEMKDGIEMVASSAASVAELSIVMTELANKGNETVHQVASQMEQINEQTQKTSMVIRQLDELSAQIGQILQVLDAISAQTHILALNAAIEAARAGENGKGFSIVAEEVRKLAGESRASSARIANLVEEIRAHMAVAVEAMNRNSKETESGMGVTQNASLIFADMRQVVLEVTEQIQEVSASAEQMRANTQRVNDSVGIMSKIAENTEMNVRRAVVSVGMQLSACEEVAVSANRLNGEANKLQEMVSKFEV
ncbi:methyl-accepting chemotaxis protein [Brevibacillus parabrevis]|uniref:methyl-accepting chemotaxis protein n=1 Tax=Brevibacillus parabrevis TaxID=54914 RepID=UPI002E221D62|nr:methyl-accepting chemotaxis protein [Brevibacillus parabrevis]MED1723081.1 methyl-accepting chemotaxis protein [Brevibacillus parabrevis]